MPQSNKRSGSEMPQAARDGASLDLRHVLMGGGAFDVSGVHPNRKGWESFGLGINIQPRRLENNEDNSDSNGRSSSTDQPSTVVSTRNP